ncbi:Hypothetical predicted protein [Cloeon dipterum]|uniref:Uncharacterized protein n=1 Tax=Cloeon dipterum TaxID=197152 RepID=A0A8S1C069_9INSE|nr:Hypothetical predicted protein [Cloeon dipterum]
MELETQLYIVAGVLSGAIVILFALVIALIVRLEKQRKERKTNEARFLSNADPNIRKGEEIEKRGYSLYKGVPGQPQVPPTRTSSLVHEQRDYQRDSHRDSRPASASGHYGRDHRRH